MGPQLRAAPSRVTRKAIASKARASNPSRIDEKSPAIELGGDVL